MTDRECLLIVYGTLNAMNADVVILSMVNDQLFPMRNAESANIGSEAFLVHREVPNTEQESTT
jgi:hypothetical protein